MGEIPPQPACDISPTFPHCQPLSPIIHHLSPPFTPHFPHWHTLDTMNDSFASLPLNNWELEREIVLTRVLNAPRDAVFAAWTTPEAYAQWFGPDGFTTMVHHMDAQVGGITRFDMVAPDGTVFTNRYHYFEVVPNQKLVMDHGSDIDNDPDRFRVTVTFDQQDDGKTVVTLRQLQPTVEKRNAVISWGAVELGLQTLNKLAMYLGAAA